jgi:hypothetical protein
MGYLIKVLGNLLSVIINYRQCATFQNIDSLINKLSILEFEMTDLFTKSLILKIVSLS